MCKIQRCEEKRKLLATNVQIFIRWRRKLLKNLWETEIINRLFLHIKVIKSRSMLCCPCRDTRIEKQTLGKMSIRDVFYVLSTVF